eukprot:3642715-Prymnesium_polylepis.1
MIAAVIAATESTLAGGGAGAIDGGVTDGDDDAQTPGPDQHVPAPSPQSSQVPASTDHASERSAHRHRF